ncbi:MAG: hypothetical protein SCK29_07935 [Bacillota bacterium]|nr:hypothetical protein [Bacillota bacterium]MDW7684026.1 hypothetical protein [Bacillota bacterium]
MEGLDGKIEFLCLGCGLQGLQEAHWPRSVEESGVLCPKCGDHVITTHLLKKENDLLLTV